VSISAPRPSSTLASTRRAGPLTEVAVGSARMGRRIGEPVAHHGLELAAELCDGGSLHVARGDDRLAIVLAGAR